MQIDHLDEIIRRFAELHLRRTELANILCEWLTKYREGDFRELKSQKNLGSMLSDPLRSLRLRRSFRKSVSINPGSAPNLADAVDMIGCYFGALCDITQYSVLIKN